MLNRYQNQRFPGYNHGMLRQMSMPCSSLGQGGYAGEQQRGSQRRYGEPVDQYPIAMAYVPWQRWQQVYPMEQGLVRGTIFPELDKPFLKGGCR